MHTEELIKKYFELTDDEKDELLSDIVLNYFQINRALGHSNSEIIKGIDSIIEKANENEFYEMSQAFLDIKKQIEITLKEWDVTANEKNK